MVRADLERLIASHHEADFLGFAMCKDANIASSPFLPFASIRIEAEELCAPGKSKEITDDAQIDFKARFRDEARGVTVIAISSKKERVRGRNQAAARSDARQRTS